MNFTYEENRIYLKNEENKIIAEVDFPQEGENLVKITRTFVDESLRGQGLAGKLLEECVKVLRVKNLKCIPECSYAVKWFERHSEEQDLIK